MQVRETLAISATQFFDHILLSIQFDLKESAKLNVDVAQIREGLEFTKTITTKMKQKDETHVVITKLEKPTVYQATFDSSQGRTVITYTVHEVDESHCEVFYDEIFTGKDSAKKLNHKLMSVFYNGRSKKRIHYLLRAIENHVLKGEENA